MIRAILVVVIIVVTACHPARDAPPRPLGVPRTAAWAGGADGGTWVDCWRDKDRAERFDCALYRETGQVDARGSFVLLDAAWDDVAKAPRYAPTANAHAPMRYDAYDGTTIHLEGPGVLVRERCASCADSACTVAVDCR